MSSEKIITTTVTTEESSDSSCDSGSSSKTSHSNSEVYKTALSEKTSSDEFELARDHFSTTFFSALDETIEYDIAELNAHICSAKKEPVKKIPTTQVQVKTGRCNCTPSKRNLLAQRKLKLEPKTVPKTETKTNNGSENIDKKYNIKVPEISAKYSSSGIIKIPIEVRLTLKQSSGDEEDLPEEPRTGTEGVKPPRDWPTIKCIYEDCCAWEYMETYLDELLDDPEEGEFPTGAHGTDLVFNGECTDHYAEPYHAVGFINSEDQFQLPIDYDDLIPPELLARKNDSFGKIKIPEKDVIIVVDDDDSLIHWEDVCIPPLEKVKIAAIPVEPDEPIAPHRIPVPEGYIPPVAPRPDSDESEKKKKKCFSFSSCCGGEDDEEDEYGFPLPPRRKQTSLVFQPVPKTSLIYGHHCTENEPYTRQLLKAFPHHEKSDSPCSSVTEIPWQKILLTEAAKIRPIDIAEVKTEPSASANTLCACASIKDTVDVKPKKSVSASGLCTCPSYHELVRNLPDKLDVKPNIKDICPGNASPSKNTVSFRDNKLVTLYPPPNLQSKSKSGTPMLKEPVGMIKTILSGKSKSEEGIMRTKVTLSGKDLNRLLESQGKIGSSNIIKSEGYQKFTTKQICPASSNVSTSHSAPVLPKQEVCAPETCPVNIKVEPKTLSSQTIKADPVISALIACEAELKPVKQALNTVQQKLRNMNMPELDSIFSKGTELANVFLNKAQQNRCTCANRYAASGYNPNPTMKPVNVKFMNNRMTTYARPMSSYPATYKSPAPSSTYVPQRPRPYVEQCPYYGQYQQSTSQSSSCAPSVQNFSMWPNYDRRDLYPDERKPSKSALKRPGHRDKQRVKYQRDQSEDWRSADRSERICCCSSSNYSSRNGIQVRKSEDEMTFTSSSSPSEDSVTKTRRARRRHRRLIPKVKSKNSGIVSRQSLCPFLEAMKSIMILDNKKTVKRGVNGISYDTKLSTKKIKNMRMHMRVRTSKVSKK